ncbi:MAG: ABC transporter substrate-binding protein [Leptospiraceae bacterium]
MIRSLIRNYFQPRLPRDLIDLVPGHRSPSRSRFHNATLPGFVFLALLIPFSIQSQPVQTDRPGVNSEGEIIDHVPEENPGIAPGAVLEPVRLQLKWKHQFQFAGYYAAVEKGFYREAGLDVEILEAQEGQETIERVLDGHAEFGVGTTDLVLMHQKGEPVVVLAVIFQHSPLALLLRKDSGIQTLHGLEGKKVMIEPHSAELFAYLNREGVSLHKLIQPPHTFNTEALVQGKADAMSVYITDEPFALRSRNVPYLLFSPRAAGIDFYGDNLFTTQEEVENHPERVRLFREASLRGWRYAMENKEEIIQLIYNKYSQRHSLDHLRFEARQMELLMPDIVEVGHMYPGRWEHIASVYSELNMMRSDYDLDGFMYDPSPDTDLTWFYATLAITVLIALVVSLVALTVHRLNLDLRKSESMRRQAERIIQHDLKSPLGIILGYSEMLLTDSEDSPHVDVYRRINRSAAQMLEMVKRSMDIFEMESGQHKMSGDPVDLNQLLQEVIAGFSRMARTKEVTVIGSQGERLLDQSPPCMIPGDALYLKTMLENLIKNAIEASPDGADVSINVEEPGQAESSILISIHNKGVIPESVRSSFFDRYSRGPSSGGAGLGTYSAHLIATAHGGSISFKTDEQKGTELIVSLPGLNALSARDSQK